MADEQKNPGSNANSPDPFEPFRAMRDAWLDSMAKTMVQTVNTEAYAEATGAMLEGTLSAAAPFREVMEKSMTQALQQLSLPSRQELAALAERFTNVEMRLDDMDAKLDWIEELLRAKASPAPATPAPATPAPAISEPPPGDPVNAGTPVASQNSDSAPESSPESSMPPAARTRRSSPRARGMQR